MASTTATFRGFPTELQKFLKGLSRTNTKKWFDAHRSDYDEYVMGPARLFVPAAHEALKAIAPNVECEAKVNASIRRINRDIRFSKDKRPYKDHLDIYFWEGDRRKAISGFYLRIMPDRIGVGTGAHGFDKTNLGAFRDAVVDKKEGAALVRAVKATEKAGYAVRGEAYKRVPKGYDVSGDAERLILYGGLWCGEDDATPKSFHTKRFVDWCLTRWKKSAPIHRWLVDTLQ